MKRKFSIQVRLFSATNSDGLLLRYMEKDDWIVEAKNHSKLIVDLLYPPGPSIKARQHYVRNHPVFNFIHQYYRFSAKALTQYSPGANIVLKHSLEALPIQFSEVLTLHEGLRAPAIESQGYFHCPSALLREPNLKLIQKLSGSGRSHYEELVRCREMLRRGLERRPLFSCFGLHEWAMQYKTSTKLPPKQDKLALRVSQDVINSTVDNNKLRCTHFDAWRFFHPVTKPMNIYPVMSRKDQLAYEQPGCIHNTMDLFRIGYLTYPLISAELLRKTLEIAIKARVIDMRSSPYDCSHVPGCEVIIPVETPEGRKQMMEEQEALYDASRPIRQELWQEVDAILQQVERKAAEA